MEREPTEKVKIRYELIQTSLPMYYLEKFFGSFKKTLCTGLRGPQTSLTYVAGAYTADLGGSHCPWKNSRGHILHF